MAKNLKVILLEDVASLGRAGDIVEVSEGYARNSLIPEALAAIADSSTRAKAADKKKTEEKKKQSELEKNQQLAESLEGTELTLEARVKDGNEIFGSISAKNIADELKKQAKISIKPNDIKLDEALTTLGSHEVIVNLLADVETTIRVTIIADPESQQNDDEE